MRQDREVTAERASKPPAPARRPGLRDRARARRADVVDVFVYVVVLNLTVEYFPSVISEAFTVSLLTAVLLKLALELVLLIKGGLFVWLRAGRTPAGKVVGVLALWALAAGSKLVILWVVDLVFGDSVSLGGFVTVTLLVLALLVARRTVRWLLGEPPEPGP
jgi:hypothetical protein